MHSSKGVIRFSTQVVCKHFCSPFYYAPPPLYLPPKSVGLRRERKAMHLGENAERYCHNIRVYVSALHVGQGAEGFFMMRSIRIIKEPNRLSTTVHREIRLHRRGAPIANACFFKMVRLHVYPSQTLLFIVHQEIRQARSERRK